MTSAPTELHTAYIVDSIRTPVGAFQGNLSALTAPQLGQFALSGLIQKTGISTDILDDVILGCVLPAGIGQAPARQAMRFAGIGDHVHALTINKVCGSGLKAVTLARSEILAGESHLLIAGGMESMSQVPYYLPKARTGYRMGNGQLVDGMIHDGLWDPYDDMHMGMCGEACAEKYSFTRSDQDAFAKTSYERARQAIQQGLFNSEIAAVDIPQRKGDPITVNEDEQPFKDDPDKLDKLRPAFKKDGGTITAGNASSINDGAATILLASQQGLTEHGLTPKAKIVATATHSQAPLWFTTAPSDAIKAVLNKANLTVDDIDRFEINEAFACVTMSAMVDCNIPHEKVNVRGGAIAIGHPIGASGARILTTLLHTLEQEGLQRGLATLCNGGGEAVAIIIERV